MRARLPDSSSTLRRVPVCPATLEALKPVMSVAGMVWVMFPRTSAALPHPDPRVMAMS